LARLNLGLALARLDRFDEALEQYKKALDAASAQNNQVLADRIRAKVKLAGSGH